jgi:phosphoglycolate phosphatase
VIFDLDGTLVDSLEDLADSMNAVLSRSEFPQHPPEAYKYFIGDGVEMLVWRALPADRRDEAAVPEYVAAMRAEYATRWANKTRPYPEIPELLDELASREVRTAILTNKPHEPTLAMVALLLGRWRFDVVLGARASVPKKPDPAGALEVAQRMDLDPALFLYVGDTAIDMLTARAAGMRPIGALWGFRTADELEAAGAEVLIERPLQLLKHLDGLG